MIIVWAYRSRFILLLVGYSVGYSVCWPIDLDLSTSQFLSMLYCT